MQPSLGSLSAWLTSSACLVAAVSVSGRDAASATGIIAARDGSSALSNLTAGFENQKYQWADYPWQVKDRGIHFHKGGWHPSHDQLHQLFLPTKVQCPSLETGYVDTTRLKYFYAPDIENFLLEGRKTGRYGEYDVYEIDFQTKDEFSNNVFKDIYIRFLVHDYKSVWNGHYRKNEDVQEIKFQFMSVIPNTAFTVIGHPNEADLKANLCFHNDFQVRRSYKNGDDRTDWSP